MSGNPPRWTDRVHGGADHLGPITHDFSSNSNACGPCPQALAQIQQCDPASYPDASYQGLRERIADFHGVPIARVLLAASASEFIFRVSAWVARSRNPSVCMPKHAYGEYRHAALAWGLQHQSDPMAAGLLWLCDPGSPLGQDESGSFALPDAPSLTVLDCAYAPLRLQGLAWLAREEAASVWQLWSPNKALGLTGVRAAYVLAPENSEEVCEALMRFCPSWPLGAHGVALLDAWVRPQVQAWVQMSLVTLREWKRGQIDMLLDLGWDCLPSQTTFFCARPALAQPSEYLAHNWSQLFAQLRGEGIKLRDASSFGLPAHVRLSVQAPKSQMALRQAWLTMRDRLAGHPLEQGAA